MKAILLFLFFGIFAFGEIGAKSAVANDATASKDALVLPSLEDTESHNMFPFETGKSPLDNISGFQYFGVILVLLGLLAFLWSVKNRLNSPKMKAHQSPLRFFSKETKEGDGRVEVQSVTTLGAQSKLVIFEAYNKRYLVVLNPNGTMLIDSYETKSMFKDMLEQDSQKNAK
ncbi:hypothetical protein [Helicobacter sp.]|uniref:hypothetical protein n=1 Tax=Helicobacter sp. TaxID=218 RepID=UPI0025BD79EF|nr:hypothetical protein [Helicobacter sp.]MCI5969399.1 hypothetical protein [Helicobacter sp.]MDY2585654.1 hypothetical protein [Helicobacter sp.]